MSDLVGFLIAVLSAAVAFVMFVALAYWATPEDERKSNEAFITMLKQNKHKSNT